MALVELDKCQIVVIKVNRFNKIINFFVFLFTLCVYFFCFNFGCQIFLILLWFCFLFLIHLLKFLKSNKYTARSALIMFFINILSDLIPYNPFVSYNSNKKQCINKNSFLKFRLFLKIDLLKKNENYIKSKNVSEDIP